MGEDRIEPHRITKPIQLLGAWLAGLAIINSSFLFAASSIHSPTWIPGLLAIAAVANVPVFILSLFILQTKFRPEMQEDVYYSKYLEHKYSRARALAPVDIERNIREVAGKILREIPKPEPHQEKRLVEILKESEIEQLKDRFKNSRSLSELYLDPNNWSELVADWRGDPSFHEDVQELRDAGLVLSENDGLDQIKLTEIGRDVALRLESENLLWNQRLDRPAPRKNRRHVANKDRLQTF
jgi:hypothetical protein